MFDEHHALMLLRFDRESANRNGQTGPDTGDR
jgi:hypothetical protein